MGEQDFFVGELAKVVMPQSYGSGDLINDLSTWETFELLRADSKLYNEAYNNFLILLENL